MTEDHIFPENFIKHEMTNGVIDITGVKYSNLTALSFEGFILKGFSKKKTAYWKFRCDCGKITFKLASKVKEGHVKSCGCLSSFEFKSQRARTHGMSSSETYNSWSKMLSRCFDKNSDVWDYYGGRGIVVCERWQNSFENFLEDMGERPKDKTLDRVDTNGNYEPLNCRWSGKTEQSFNRNRQSNNTSGRTGVVFDKRSKSWVATIKVNKRCVYLGSSENFNTATKLRDVAELKYYGFIKK
jgi:hypothetical protein